MSNDIRIRVLRAIAVVSASSLAMALLISQCWFRVSDHVETKAIECMWLHQDSWYDNCHFYYAESSTWFIVGQIVDETWIGLYAIGALGGALTVAYSLLLLAGAVWRRGMFFLHHGKR